MRQQQGRERGTGCRGHEVTPIDGRTGLRAVSHGPGVGQDGETADLKVCSGEHPGRALVPQQRDSGRGELQQPGAGPSCTRGAYITCLVEREVTLEVGPRRFPRERASCKQSRVLLRQRPGYIRKPELWASAWERQWSPLRYHFQIYEDREIWKESRIRSSNKELREGN